MVENNIQTVEKHLSLHIDVMFVVTPCSSYHHHLMLAMSDVTDKVATSNVVLKKGLRGQILVNTGKSLST